MDAQKRYDLITRNAEEVLTPEDLKQLIEWGAPLNHYIGFEISGKVHLGTGLMCGSKIADFQKAKVNCSAYLATYHAWINDKLGGDLEVIRGASEYFKQGLMAGIETMGGDPDKVKFVSGDELYHNNDDYWRLVIEIAKKTTLNRTLRAISVMGRDAGGKVPLAYLMYPAMQVADIFVQNLNLAHAGMDQRKAHVVARELAKKLKVKNLVYKKETYKPVAIHHHLLLGLQKPAVWPVPKEKAHEFWASMKMSKSVKGSAVYVHDSPEEIRKKLKKAFCPEGNTDFNPVLDWTKHLLFNKEKSELKIERPEKFGGDVTYTSYTDLEKDFGAKKLHPGDLKSAVAEGLVKLLEPARKRFEKPKIKKLKEEMDKLTITR